VKKIVDLARSTPGRITAALAGLAAALAGLAAVAFIVRGLGLHAIGDAIAGFGPYFLLVRNFSVLYSGSLFTVLSEDLR
jgi:hypothetical protein